MLRTLIFLCCFIPLLANKKEPLIEASRFGQLDEVIQLLESGHDVNCRDYRENTPLLAVGSKYPIGKPGNDISVIDSIVQLLIDHGAELDALNRNGNTPLHIFASHPLYLQCVKKLIKAGARVNIEDRHGQFAISNAFFTKHSNSVIVRELMENGADLTAVNTKGKTVLHVAAEKYPYAVFSILQAGGDCLVNTKDYEGKIPLASLLSTRGKISLPVFDELCKNVDMTVTDKRDYTLIDALLWGDRTQRSDRVDLIYVLLKAGVSANSNMVRLGRSSYQHSYFASRYEKSRSKQSKKQHRAICKALESSGHNFSSERREINKEYAVGLFKSTFSAITTILRFLLFSLPVFILFVVMHRKFYSTEKGRKWLMAIHCSFSLIAISIIAGVLGALLFLNTIAVSLDLSFAALFIIIILGPVIGCIIGVYLSIRQVYYRPLYYLSPFFLTLLFSGVALSTSGW